jgi:hypothetical protein
MRNARNRIVREAALNFMLCAGIILGATGLVMFATVWSRPVARDRDLFYTNLPEVDLSGVPPTRLPALLRELNSRRCTCGCMRTIAGCRNHHGSCALSKAAAQAAVAAARKQY